MKAVVAPKFTPSDAARSRIDSALQRQRVEHTPDPGALPVPPWRVVPLDDLDGAETQPQAWHWEGLIPSRALTLLGAHGGTGKSTLALMLGVAVAMGVPFFGARTRRAPVVFFSAEDDADVLRRRMVQITRLMGARVDELAHHMWVLDATEFAAELAATRGGETPEGDLAPSAMRLTETGQALRQFLANMSAPLLIVDNASDTYAGNEIARAEVRGFVRALVRLVRPQGGAVLLLAHVDKGTSRGDRAGNENYSGSTAWHNSARSRLFLGREKESDTLVLRQEKSNYGRLCDPIRLTWPTGGLPMLDMPAAGIVGTIATDNIAKALLRLIADCNARGENVSTATSGPATLTALHSGSPHYPRGARPPRVNEAMREAQRRGWIEREPFRTPNRKPGERWQITPAGRDAAGIPQGALVAPVAPIPATSATDELAQRPAPVAPVLGARGVGGKERAQPPHPTLADDDAEVIG